MRALDGMLGLVLNKETELEPKKKLNALRVSFLEKIISKLKIFCFSKTKNSQFIKEAMNLKNPLFAEILAENTYALLLDIASFKAEEQDDERGRDFFGVGQGKKKILIF